MATLFCTLVLTLHKIVLYAFHRGILRPHEIRPAPERVFYFSDKKCAFLLECLNALIALLLWLMHRLIKLMIGVFAKK